MVDWAVEDFCGGSLVLITSRSFQVLRRNRNDALLEGELLVIVRFCRAHCAAEGGYAGYGPNARPHDEIKHKEFFF